MKRIAIYNRKGGVGKTVGASAISGILSHARHRVLLIDLDTQANLTAGLITAPPEDEITEFYRSGRLPVMPLSYYWDIVPSSIQLAGIDYKLGDRSDRYTALGKALDACDDEYDFAVMDLGSAMNYINVGAVAACDYLLCPVYPDADSLQGLRLVEEVCRYAGKDGIDGIYFSNYSERRRLDRIYEEELSARYGNIVFTAKIRQCQQLRECGRHGLDIISYAPKSNGAKDFHELTNELLQRIGWNE